MILTLMLLAAPIERVDAIVKMVDPKFGMFIVAVKFNGGHKYLAYKIDKGTKFFDRNGKEMKKGLYSDVFKSPNHRPTVPITIVFYRKSIKYIEVK